MRVLALDIGTKKVGIAISSLDQKVIFPVTKIQFSKFRGKEFFDLLKTSLDSYWLEIEEVVIGDGNDPDFYNPIIKTINQVVRILKAWTGWKVTLISEINSSIESNNILKKLDYSFQKRRSLVDSYAALILLQDYFVSKNREILVSY